MSPKTYRVFSAVFITVCLVLFVVNRAVFDRDMPTWLMVPVLVFVVVGLVVDTMYQRRRAKRGGRI